MKIQRNDILFTISLLLAIWFVLTGMIWVYYAALIIGYPAGLVSFLLWRMIRSENKKRTAYIPLILAIGLGLSFGALVYLLLFE